MAVFGDFTLLETLGASETADRYKATHKKLGGPFFLKVYRRLPPAQLGPMQQRGDRLIGLQHPHLAPHLGHGVVDGIGFAVSPWLDGIDLEEAAASLKDRRVNLTLDQCLLILGDLAGGVAALHQAAATQSGGSLLAHGDVSIRHVRLGPDGQIWLTGLCTPRGLTPDRPPEARFDLAGVGALMYDLVPLLRGGAARPPLPTLLDRVIRRALGIGPVSEHLQPVEFAERLGEVFQALKLSAERQPLVDLVQRTIRAVEKRLAEQGGRSSIGGSRTPADAIPELAPVTRPPSGRVDVADLEPLDPVPAPVKPALRPAIPAPTPVVPPARSPFDRPFQSPTYEQPPPAADVGTPPDKPLFAMFGRPPSIAASDPSFLTGSAARSPTPAPALTGPPPAPAVPAPPPPLLNPVLTPSPFDTPPSAPLRPAAPASFEADTTRPSPFPPPGHPAAAVTPGAAPRPATMPHMPVLSPGFGAPGLGPDLAPDLAPDPAPDLVPDGAGLFDPLPGAGRPALLADEPSGANRLSPRPLSVEGPAQGAPPPALAPAPAVNPALGERTDPDALRPVRVEAQKALPAVKALLRAGVATVEQVERAAAEQASRGGRTLEILVAHGVCTDLDVANTLAVAANRDRLADSDVVVKEQALLKRLPQTYALARRILPLALDGGRLVLAMADPFDDKVIAEVRELLHAIDVDVRVAARATLTQATLSAFAELHGKDVVDAGPRILLGIQDDDKAQKLGARLAQEGMQVEHVVDGATARQIIQGRPPDAVICTYNLPGVDGQGLLMAARTHEKTAELPVYIIGPRSDDDLMAKVLDLGADDYFGEPVRPDVVVAKLRRAVGKMLRSPSTPPEPAAAPTSSKPPPLPRTKTIPMPTRPPEGGSPFDEFGFDDLPDLPPEFESESGPVDVPAMPTGVMGTLRQMALPEIVQSLEMGRKTASVDIVPQDGEKGAIAFDTGAIRFAECGALQGEEAFFALMRHKEGFFRIHYGDAPKAVNIESPTTFLLLEAMRLMDEEGL